MFILPLFFSLFHPQTALAEPKLDSDIHYILDEALQPVMDMTMFQQTDVGIQVLDVETGEEVFAYNAEDLYTPASVMKILTAAIAYRTLGSDFRFKTEYFTDGEIADGVLNGNLYIRGTGDPTLVAEKLWKVVHDLKNLGIDEISGRIIYDDSHFGGTTMIPGWTKEVDILNGPSYFPPLSSLSINYNNIALMVRPASVIGEQADVYLEYPVSFINIESDVLTVSPNSKPWMTVERTQEDGVTTFTIKGKIHHGEIQPWTYYRTIPDPVLLFQELFRQVSDHNNLRIRGRDKLGTVPVNAQLLTTQYSQPLRELTADMNKHSRNLIAENLIRAVGFEYSGEATTQEGLDVLADYLSDLGIPESDYTLINGSGLSPDLQIKPSVITTVLLDIYQDPTLRHEFLASLAVNGQEGTLKWRLEEEPTYSKMRGKTGSINGVYCLGGYIRTNEDKVYAFAFFVNDIQRSVRNVRNAQDWFAEIIMKYPQIVEP